MTLHRDRTDKQAGWGNFFHTLPLIGTGDFKDEVTVLIIRTADEQTSTVEELDLGLENGTFVLQHLQREVGPAGADFMGCNLQLAITGQEHNARLASSQVQIFAAEQTVGGEVEQGLQFAYVPFQLWIDP